MIEQIMPAQEICAVQYIYWQSLGWTHHEMLAAVGQPHVVGMTGDAVVSEITVAWQSLNRMGRAR